MAMGVPDPRTGVPRGLPLTVDPRYVMDARQNPFWYAQEAGSGSITAGNGDGTGFLDFSKIPGYTGGDPRQWLAENNYRVYDDWSEGSQWVTRGIVDSDGNAVGGLQRERVSNEDAFWTAGMLAGAVTGANIFSASGKALADATGGGALDGLMSGLGGESAADLTARQVLYGASGYGPGMSGLQTSIYDGVMGLTGSGGLASVASGSNVGGGLASLASSALGSGVGGAVGGAMSGGWLGNLASLYGLYLNKKGLDNAEDAMGRAGELSSAIASRQMGLAEEQYRDYKTGVLPRLMGSMDKADQRADLASQQATKMFDLNYADADRYSKRWRDVQVPLEDSIIAEAQRLGTPQEEERVRGLALADVRGQGEMMRAAGQRDAARRGINPASAAAMALASDAFMAEGLAGAGAMTNASFGVKDRYRAAMTDAAALGRNLPGFASSASGAGTAAGGLQLNSGTGNVGAQAQGANAMSNFNQGINQGWNNASSTAFNGYRAASDYASLVANSPFSTMAGIGMYPWLQPPRS